MGLVELVYKLTAQLPGTEKYGLLSQMRRVAVSAPSNISEGAVFDTSRAFQRYLRIAAGSLSELETQLILVTRLDLVARGAIEPVLQETREVRRMTVSLIKRHSG
jgi:four helix bundle protein